MRRGSFTTEQLDKMIRLCRTDLFFLAKDVMNKTFTEFTHRSVCDFYVKKNPYVYPTFREFADAYEGPKDRLMLLSRKGYKSTAKIIDNVQWVICWPDISILTLTAEKGLARAFVEEFQHYFIVKRAERNPETKNLEGGDPNIFQELFLEHCITEKEATSSGNYETPARKKFTKEPTIGALSIQSSGSGWSCDIEDFDDVLSDDNTETGLQLEKLENRIAMATKLKKPYGFRHLVGTRYDPNDAYAHIAEANGVKELYGEFETPTFKYMCKPCWWLKGKPYMQPDYSTWKPAQEEMDLFFPEDLPFKVLAKELRENPEVFFSQMLNDPIEAAGVTFTEELIRSCFVDHTQLPKRGNVYTVWDLAYGTEKGRDYRVGVHGFLDEQGRWWIIGITRGRFNHAELPFQIVNNVRIYRPKNMTIEDSQGAKWLLEAIDRHSKELGVIMDINWVKVDTSDNAKFNRMSRAYEPMTSKRLFFLNTISCADDLIKEYKNVGNKRMRNDIPDTIGRLIETYSSVAHIGTLPTPAEDARAWRELEDREFYNLIFQRGTYEPREPEPVIVQEEEEYFTDPYTGLPSPSPY
jgi:hypothetical protein